MVRPGLKRLRRALNVKVQPNKTGTSTMLGNNVALAKGVHFNSAGNTPYNNLANSRSFVPTYTAAEKLLDQNRRCVEKKEWHTEGGVIRKN